jgi:hypothetical protein
MSAKFQFGNVVVVNKEFIGVIVKTWQGKDGFNYDVYVRYYSTIENYKEADIKHYIYSKELSTEEVDWYE